MHARYVFKTKAVLYTTDKYGYNITPSPCDPTASLATQPAACRNTYKYIYHFSKYVKN